MSQGYGTSDASDTRKGFNSRSSWWVIICKSFAYTSIFTVLQSNRDINPLFLEFIAPDCMAAPPWTPQLFRPARVAKLQCWMILEDPPKSQNISMTNIFTIFFRFSGPFFDWSNHFSVFFVPFWYSKCPGFHLRPSPGSWPGLRAKTSKFNSTQRQGNNPRSTLSTPDAVRLRLWL